MRRRDKGEIKKNDDDNSDDDDDDDDDDDCAGDSLKALPVLATAVPCHPLFLLLLGLCCGTTCATSAPPTRP